jgi:glycerate 2-kinase
MGGRNQEFALAFALEFEGSTWETGDGQNVSLLSAGTDGSDGPNDAAGAIVDGKTVSRARTLCIEPRSYLDNNDSYTFFQDFDTAAGTRSHLKTGPTGTNVMDIQIVILNKSVPPHAQPD